MTWKISTLEDAADVINILHQRSIRDLNRILDLELRMALREEPWWKKILK